MPLLACILMQYIVYLCIIIIVLGRMRTADETYLSHQGIKPKSKVGGMCKFFKQKDFVVFVVFSIFFFYNLLSMIVLIRNLG